jgi:hypothetical protein
MVLSNQAPEGEWVGRSIIVRDIIVLDTGQSVMLKT